MCKYENINKLGKFVFATVHEPRNLITLIKNKDIDDHNVIIEKVRKLIESEIYHEEKNHIVNNDASIKKKKRIMLLILIIIYIMWTKKVMIIYVKTLRMMEKVKMGKIYLLHVRKNITILL